MKNICHHLQNLKPQKIANIIKKSSFKCNVSKHIDTEYNLCLHCGQTRCNGQNNCSKNHAEGNKHPLVLKLLSCYVYCYSCDVEIESMFDEIDVDGGGNDKIQKMRGLYEKIRELAIKNLPNIHQQRKSVEPTKQSNNQSKKQHKHSKQNLQSSNIQLRTFGLANIGNTCYFNSILQCLYSTIKIHQFYEKISLKDDFNISFRKFLQNTQKVFSPKNIFSLLGRNYKFLKGMGQQDAFQLYVLLIDSLIQSAHHKQQDFKTKIENSIGSIFGFNCASRLQCLNCGKISWTQDFNLGLTVPLSRASNKIIEMPAGQEIDSQEIGEEGLCYPDKQNSNTFLDNFFSAEVLSKPNSYEREVNQDQRKERREILSLIKIGLRNKMIFLWLLNYKTLKTSILRVYLYKNQKSPKNIIKSNYNDPSFASLSFDNNFLIKHSLPNPKKHQPNPTHTDNIRLLMISEGTDQKPNKNGNKIHHIQHTMIFSHRQRSNKKPLTKNKRQPSCKQTHRQIPNTRFIIKIRISHSTQHNKNQPQYKINLKSISLSFFSNNNTQSPHRHRPQKYQTKKSLNYGIIGYIILEFCMILIIFINHLSYYITINCNQRTHKPNNNPNSLSHIYSDPVHAEIYQKYEQCATACDCVHDGQREYEL